jgi:replicative DNA helicase
MIVVDYIQLMRGTTYNKDGRVQEISQITQGLKAIAKELSCSSCCFITTFKTS